MARPLYRSVLKARDEKRAFLPSQFRRDVKYDGEWSSQTTASEAMSLGQDILLKLAAEVKRNHAHRADYSRVIHSLENWWMDHIDLCVEAQQNFGLSDFIWLVLAHLHCHDIAHLDSTEMKEARMVLAAVVPDEYKGPLPAAWTAETFAEVVLLSELKCRVMTFHWTFSTNWHSELQVPNAPPPQDPRTLAKLIPGTLPKPFPTTEHVVDPRASTTLGQKLQLLTNECLLLMGALVVVSSKPRACHEIVNLCTRLHRGISLFKWSYLQFERFSTVAPESDLEVMRSKFHAWLVEQCTCGGEDALEAPFVKLLEMSLLPVGSFEYYARLKGPNSADRLRIKLKTNADLLLPASYCTDNMETRIAAIGRTRPSKLLDDNKMDMYDLIAMAAFAFAFESTFKIDFMAKYTRMTEDVGDGLLEIPKSKTFGPIARELLPLIVAYCRRIMIRFEAKWMLCTSRRDALIVWCWLVMTQRAGKLETGVNIATFCKRFYIEPSPPALEPASPSPSFNGAAAAAAMTTPDVSPAPSPVRDSLATPAEHKRRPSRSYARSPSSSPSRRRSRSPRRPLPPEDDSNSEEGDDETPAFTEMQKTHKLAMARASLNERTQERKARRVARASRSRRRPSRSRSRSTSR
jgi:hypothetical protein